MKPILLLMVLLLVISNTAYGQLYEWIDDSGSVNFTDDPDKIPAKYRNRVKPREDAVKESPDARGTVREKAAAQPEVTPAGPKLYDGRGLSWWQTSYAERVKQVEALKGELSTRKEEQMIARRKKVTLSRMTDRKLLAQKTEEVAAKEAQMKNAEKDLAEFRSYAERSGLSVDMLESGSR